jgi:hypothetical protein
MQGELGHHGGRASFVIFKDDGGGGVIKWGSLSAGILRLKQVHCPETSTS